jgi:hypothetical protein
MRKSVSIMPKFDFLFTSINYSCKKVLWDWLLKANRDITVTDFWWRTIERNQNERRKSKFVQITEKKISTFMP